MPTKQPYNHNAADQLEGYVRAKKYFKQVKNSTAHLYLSLSFLERTKGLGFCKPITANIDTLADAACINRSTIDGALNELSGLLCEVKKGAPIKGGKKATELRRYSIDELSTGKQVRKLNENTPPKAAELAEVLNARSFVYGNNPKCKPYWNPQKTGRIGSRKPAVQNDPPKTRAAKLKAGCADGKILLHLDYKRAEPAIISHLLGGRFDSCTYETLIDLRSISRSEAKKELNRLAYYASSVKLLEQWPANAHEQFKPYAAALDELKEKIWEEGTGGGRRKRTAHTLTGSTIYAEKGDKTHKGKPLNWTVQGTIADLINAASLKIIEQESEKGWRFCFPEHDAVYVLAHEHQETELKNIMINEAKSIGLGLEVRIEKF